MNRTTDCDVLIIGGGPAGSTLGALMARRGHDVVLLEKETHPRFHIGESLLPMNLPILDRLGVHSEVAAFGVCKAGADFTYDNAGNFHTFHFDRALGESPGCAYEVRRSEFDQILFNNAERLGARCYQQERVVEVRNESACPKVVSRAVDGTDTTWTPRYVVDASGRDRWLASRRGWVKRNPRHGSAALFGHFEDVPRRPGGDAGNISIYWFDGGWIWMIPLQDDVTSVGVVCRPAFLKARLSERAGDALATFNAIVGQCPPAVKRLSLAKPVSVIRGAGNYSYTANQMVGPGYALIGDAFAFVDPVFSSGVYLAMNSAERAVPMIEAWLAGNEREYQQLSSEYAKVIRRGLKQFSWFIYRFTSPAMRRLFERPRNDWQVEQAVISLLAGDVFCNRKVERRLRVFRIIYALTWLRTARPSIKSWRLRRRSARSKFVHSL